jgi:hypothetical protein
MPGQHEMNILLAGLSDSGREVPPFQDGYVARAPL